MASTRAVDPVLELSNPAPDEISRPFLLFLSAAVLLLAALYLSPLAGFTYFGSDTGEYYALTQSLIRDGHLPIGGSYGGWGIGYPDFPGLFVLAAATSQGVGLGTETGLLLSIPILSAFAIVPAFLLFRRIFPSDGVALLGASFAAVAMPRAFSLAHPAPLAVGDLLAIAALWMFVEGRRDLRWYAPLALTGGALILTHHLSSYFFVLSAFGSLVLLELMRPRAWSVRLPLREIGFLTAFLLAMAADWFLLAPDFVRDVIGNSHLLGLSAPEIGALLAGGAVSGGVVTLLLLRARRRWTGRSMRPAFPSDRSVLRDGMVILVAVFGGIALLVAVPLPGTTQYATIPQLLYYAPILLLASLSAGTRRLSSLSRLGPMGLAWLLALGISALVGLLGAGAVLPPARHAEYLLIPLGLLVALGLARLIARAGDRGGPKARAAVLAGALLLLGGNAAIAFPPPAELGHFQEGLTGSDAAMAEWASFGLSPGTVVASDHRVSSMLFGYSGLRATWDSTPALFTGSDLSRADGELRGTLAPHQELPVQAVALDSTMRTQGVALDPGQPALPMSAAANLWFERTPFVPLYEEGDQVVYWVSGGLVLPAI